MGMSGPQRAVAVLERGSCAGFPASQIFIFARTRSACSWRLEKTSRREVRCAPADLSAMLKVPASYRIDRGLPAPHFSGRLLALRFVTEALCTLLVLISQCSSFFR